MHLTAGIPVILALAALSVLGVPSACQCCCPIPSLSSLPDCTLASCGNSANTLLVRESTREASVATPQQAPAAPAASAVNDIAARTLEQRAPDRLYLKFRTLLI
jgi:hypothetical protein